MWTFLNFFFFLFDFQIVSLDVSVLELFYTYMQISSSSQLGESWNSLLSLLRDGILLAPPALFLMLAILNEFVQKCPPFDEKKNQRDLQDVAAKVREIYLIYAVDFFLNIIIIIIIIGDFSWLKFVETWPERVSNIRLGLEEI